MHTLLSGFGLVLLTGLLLAAVLGVALVVLAEVRCLVRLSGQLTPDADQPPAFFADVAPSHAQRL